MLALTLGVLSGCSGTGVLNALNRADHYQTAKGIAYGPHERQRLDIYRPRESANACVIVFVYGGSWDSGAKQQYGFVAAALARRGYTVVVPDYRLYPEVTHPTFVADVAKAVASEPVQQLIADKTLVMMGHSAGAMIAGLISYDVKYLQAVGLNPDIIAAYVSLAGPHDYFLPTQNPRWANIFGDDEAEQVAALTVNHIRATNPPTLILHGASDETVTPKSAVSLEQKLKTAGVSVTRKTYPEVTHVKILAAMGRPLGFLAPTLDDVDEFLQMRCNGASVGSHAH
ncbi:alpha/beta hydrolase [Gilvimarinus polysaccharolyticus]|uniref:alpha/beta hydrolase n=1 Tax=Gilvimarinus polysaccharolyticus TaxID=863921 RepID=UPI0006733D84|nr:alpha/beta hydrolase [Gilvimarinus polysaccharolyticus]